MLAVHATILLSAFKKASNHMDYAVDRLQEGHDKASKKLQERSKKALRKQASRKLQVSLREVFLQVGNGSIIFTS